MASNIITSLLSRLSFKLQDYIISHRTLSLMLPGLLMAPLSLALPAIGFAYPKAWFFMAIFNGFGILILAFYVYHLVERSGRSGRIYSLLGQQAIIVTSHAKNSETSEEKVHTTPIYEEWSQQEIAKLLDRWGRKSKLVVHSDPICPQNWDNDFFILGGPSRNAKGASVNETMAKHVAGSFFFKEFTIDVDGKEKSVWHIVQSGIPELRIKYDKTADEGATDDHGILYIGPNPFNPNFRLVWIAGLAPYAAWGAIKLLLDREKSSQIGDQLDTPLSFCSVLFRVEFRSGDKAHIRDLSVVHFTISRGKIGIPSAASLTGK